VLTGCPDFVVKPNPQRKIPNAVEASEMRNLVFFVKIR
jgi:hypothetical protein